MKISGAEWKQFEANGWPDSYIWADESTFDDGTDLYQEGGELSVADGATFIVPDYWTAIKQDEQHGEDTGITIRALIRKWRRARDYVSIVVEIPRSADADAREYFKGKGWKAGN